MNRFHFLGYACCVLAIFLSASIGGCSRSDEANGAPSTTQSSSQPKPAASQTDYTQVLRSSASEIVSDPSNWKSNSAQMARLIEASTKIGWTDRAEVKQFKAAVLDMMVFSTTWMDRVDETRKQSLAEELKKVQGRVSVAISPVGPVAAGSISDEAQSGATNSEFIQTIQNLTKLKEEQAKQFGSLYAKLLTSYELLLNALDNKSNKPNDP